MRRREAEEKEGKKEGVERMCWDSGRYKKRGGGEVVGGGRKRCGRGIILKCILLTGSSKGG